MDRDTRTSSNMSLQMNSSPKRNDRPIIGVLAQEKKNPPKPDQTSYIAASYVKTLEAAGARVVPIMINRTLDEYKTLFNSINGVLFPGGQVDVYSSDYCRTAEIFYELALDANKRGDYFPVWGTCLGFQVLAYFTSGKDLLTETDTLSVALPLDFTDDASDSRLFAGFPADLTEDLASEPLTVNAHKLSVSLSAFNTNEELSKFYKVLSTNTDGKVEFVSTMEAYDYPIYGTQWHPEKNAFEWRKEFIPHSRSAVRTAFYVAEFFVNEARKNFHSFDSEDEERKALIYNFSPLYTDKLSPFEQIYLF